MYPDMMNIKQTGFLKLRVLRKTSFEHPILSYTVLLDLSSSLEFLCSDTERAGCLQMATGLGSIRMYMNMIAKFHR